MHNDTNKLKELAERCLTPASGSSLQECVTLDTLHKVNFSKHANPAAVLELIAEVERLRARLEIDERTPYDGIACRDETIKGLDEKCDRLKAENEALKDKLSDCAISLHGEMLQKYGGQDPEDMHPVTRRDYDRDMAEIAEYTAALEGGGR